jgi:hypothetical protein
VGEVEGPHLLPQPTQVRAAVSGQRLDGLGGATLIVIYSPKHGAWAFYLDSDPRQAVLISVSKIGPLVRLLLREGS